MAQTNHINERSNGRVNSNRQVLANDEFLSPDIKRVTREDVNRNGLAQRWGATAARDRYVDLGRNDVGKAMASQSGHEAQRAARRAMRDLEEILIDLFCISPAVQAASDLLQDPLISPCIQPLCRQACGTGLGIGEDGGQLPPDGLGCFSAHR